MSVRQAIICDGCTTAYALLEHKWSQEHFSGNGWSFEGTDPTTGDRRDFCVPCTNTREMTPYFANESTP